MNIGARIKSIRDEFFLTQSSFGEKLGVSHSHISNMEANKDNPSMTLIKLISTIFNVNEEWLRTGKGERCRNPMVMPEKVFGHRLRAERVKRNLTLGDLAEELGLSNPTIIKYERNERRPDYSMLIRIARYFNVSTDFLLGLSETKQLYKDRVHQSDEGATEDIDAPEITALTKDVLEYAFEAISNEAVKIYNKDQNYQEASDRYNELRIAIEELLPLDKKDLLDRLYEADREMECIADKQTFLTTLKFGVKMTKLITTI